MKKKMEMTAQIKCRDCHKKIELLFNDIDKDSKCISTADCECGNIFEVAAYLLLVYEMD